MKENQGSSKWQKLGLLGILLILLGILVVGGRIEPKKKADEIETVAEPSLIIEPKYVEPEILIVIPCTLDDIVKRNTIRETWGKDLKNNMKLEFFMGIQGNEIKKSALEEKKLNDDMVLMDIEDNYRNLTYKMAEIHLYLKNHYTKVKWIFKTDTDVWINIKELIDILKMPTRRKAIGLFAVDYTVHKTGVFKNLDYASTKYPTFLAGCGYGLSFDVVQWIAEQHEHNWLKIMPNEDASLGIWLSSISVGLEDHQNINLGNRECENNDFLIHHLSAVNIKKTFDSFKNCSKPCGC